MKREELERLEREAVNPRQPDTAAPLARYLDAARNHLPALLKLWAAAEDLFDEKPFSLPALRHAFRELEEIE